MIQSGTNLVVVDNSGARTVQCIKVLHKPKKQMGYTGSILVVTVKQLVRKQKSKVKTVSYTHLKLPTNREV